MFLVLTTKTVIVIGRGYIFENTARTDYFRVNSVEKQKLSELLLKKLFEELLIWWTLSLPDLVYQSRE